MIGSTDDDTRNSGESLYRSLSHPSSGRPQSSEARSLEHSEFSQILLRQLSGSVAEDANLPNNRAPAADTRNSGESLYRSLPHSSSGRPQSSSIWLFAIALLSCFLYTPSSALAADTPFLVPDGFTIDTYATDDLAHDIWCMTIDAKDRICVGGPGYIKYLLDTDGDGTADKATTFTTGVRRGPMGLLIESEHLYSVEANAVLRYTDTDGDLVADGEPEELVTFTGKGGEHGPHGIRRGPDGWLYVICGNTSGVDDSHAGYASPVKEPDQGCVLRISPDGTETEVVAHGFRNPYDIAFDDQGRLFTYDSDNERDHHLPWYAPTRVFDIAFGSHHGWLLPGHKQSYNTPEYYTVDRFAEYRRGSPTGVEYYWHTAFPEKYRKGLFYACWTFGHIYYSPLIWDPTSEGGLMQERRYLRQQPEIFAQPHADGGFAPVDLAIDSTGALWVACGGRDTSGWVYRIVPPDGAGDSQQRQMMSLPKFLVGRQLPAEPLQHPHTVRLFHPSEQDRLRVYDAFQRTFGGINFRPEPRAIDAGYNFNAVSTMESYELTEKIKAESGLELLVEMDLKAEDALTKDAADLAAYWQSDRPAAEIEPWRLNSHKELARTLGCVQTEFAPVLEHLTTVLREDTHPTDDVHFLFCLAQIPAGRTSLANWRIAGAFLRVDKKLVAMPDAYPSRNWPLRLRELFQVHCEHSPQLMADVMWSHTLFGSSIEHSRYVETITDPALKKRVVEKMHQRISQSKAPWTTDFIRLMLEAETPIETDQLLQLWDDQPELRPALAAQLLDQGDPKADHKRFIQLLASAITREQAVAALDLIHVDLCSQSEMEIAIAALVRHSIENDVILEIGKTVYADSPIIQRLTGNAEEQTLIDRLATIDWTIGQAAPGKTFYTARGCAACHSGQNRLGPSLRKVSTRFSRTDFFRHTQYPDLAISDLYRARRYRLANGKTHIGTPIYSSPDQTLIEVADGKHINIAQKDLLLEEPLDQSPMPAHLLLGASDQDLADFWAYIKTL